eukprot:9362481-Alexandrium_andersonii.AAC.1
MQIDASHIGNALPNKITTLASGEYCENVGPLGQHAAPEVSAGNTFACKGLALNTWKGAWAGSATLLAYII